MEKITRLRLNVGSFTYEGERKISGVAMPYGVQTARSPMYSGGDGKKRVGFKVVQGALGDFESDGTIKLLHGHDDNQILGQNMDNMSLSDDGDGVRMRATLLSDDSLSKDIYARIERKWITEMSPGITWEYGKGGPSKVEEPDEDTAIFVFDQDSGIRLEEVSVVSKAAFDGTNVSVGGKADTFGFADKASATVIDKLIGEYVNRKPIVTVGINLLRGI